MNLFKCVRIQEHDDPLDPREFQDLLDPDEAPEAAADLGSIFDGISASIRGFCVNEEQKILEIRTPTSNTISTTGGGRTRSHAVTNLQYPLVCEFYADPKSAGPALAKKIPFVTEMRPGFPSTGLLQEKCEYSLFTYKVSKPHRWMQDPEMQFIFSGSTETTTSTCVTSNTFIPLKELETRIGRYGDPDDRCRAYALDWLTFLAHTTNRVLIPRQKMILQEKEWGEGHRERFNGAHLLTSDTAGNTVDSKQNTNDLKKKPGSKDKVVMSLSSKFIVNLLRPTNDDKPGADLGQYIFRRWCQVAYVAAITKKPAYAVNARFWTIPKTLQTPLVFYYAVDEDLQKVKNRISELWTRPQVPKSIKDLAKDLSPKPSGPGSFDQEWAEAIRRAHAQAASKFTTDPNVSPNASVPKCEVILAPQCTLEWKQEHVLLGRHPQGFYSTYISKALAAEMDRKGYSYFKPDRPFPKYSIDKAQELGAMITSAVFPETSATRTEITRGRIQDATKWPRFKGQSAIMDGRSATDVLQKLWGVHKARSVEWLHRSAYSYGGILDGANNTNPDSSQCKENLVWGTYECNTAMIRHESYLKRFVEKSELTVGLVTELKRDMTWNNKSLSWLVPKLSYEWICPVPGYPDHLAHHSSEFNLVSRKYPTRFEVEMDEAFDALWLPDLTKLNASATSKKNVPAVTKLKLPIVMLFAQVPGPQPQIQTQNQAQKTRPKL
ncbi:unnamed protein product [Clonostachys byssicola]|uniref:Uncharacterized protein n=1 Tax=Clonostachys byssicola TaxID=160290 RepID=A0A9N9TV27_9HYPO|nr:unnamed protein product [Clonostachys byssicola]